MASVLRWRNNNYENKELEDMTLGLDGLELSAVTKALNISKVVTDVTLGPNSKYQYTNHKDVYNRAEGTYGLNKTESHKHQFPTKRYITNGVSNRESSSSNPRTADIIDQSSRSTMKLMYELEQQRIMEVNDLMKKRMLKMEQDSRIRQLDLLTKHQYRQREIEAKVLNEEQLILRQLQEEEILACQRQQQLAQEHKQHAQRMNEWNEKIKEAEKRQKEAEEEEKRKMNEKKIQLDKIHQFQLEFRAKYELVAGAVKFSKDKQAFITRISPHTAKLKTLNEAMDQLIKQCKAGEVNIVVVQTASKIVQQADVILLALFEESEKINEQHEKSLTEASEAKQEVEKVQTTEVQTSQATQAVQSSVKSSEICAELNDFVDKVSFNMYIILQQHLQTFENSYENLVKDDKFKKYRFECQKAVNIPVNAISPTSAEHLRDKLFKLSRLISGQPVEVGHGQVVASSHPQGIYFCKNLLAKKFVWQGELTVSSKPEAAFAIAAVIVALWADFPDFGQLLLGHFHRVCPYLVPIFMPQVEGQSNQDFYKSLGYHYNESGEVEKQDKFLKRMSGIMRLYAAIVVTRPCKYQQNKSHPHGLAHAWRWISCLLNMDPRPDICATLLYDFLEVAGNAMCSHYGQQFQKLLHLLCKEYFPKIEKVTPLVSSGPMIRLEAFLQKILKQGHIPPPAGLLPPNFW